MRRDEEGEKRCDEATADGTDDTPEAVASMRALTDRPATNSSHDPTTVDDVVLASEAHALWCVHAVAFGRLTHSPLTVATASTRPTRCIASHRTAAARVSPFTSLTAPTAPPPLIMADSSSPAGRFDANAAAASRQVIEIWEPTFRMKPREEERFVPRQVEMIIRDIMDKKLKKAKFDDQKCKVRREQRLDHERRWATLASRGLATLTRSIATQFLFLV
jgi:hypothetical protein